MAGNPLYAFGALLLMAGGGLSTLTLSADGALTSNSAHFQKVTASGASRNLSLTSVAGSYAFGRWHVIWNVGTTYNVVVKKADGTTTLVTLAPGEAAWVKGARISGTNDWHTALYLSNAFTARMTTTDGVTSGNDRIVGGNVHTKTTSTTLTNSSAETTLASHSLPANMIKAGTTVRVRGSVRVTGNAAADTLLFKLRLGGTAFLTTTAVAMVANDVAEFDFVITGREAPGGTASVHAEGKATISVAGTHGTKAYSLAPANYATNGALAVDLRGTWSAASASDIAICESFVVDVVG
jgi:hypothetical protein